MRKNKQTLYIHGTLACGFDIHGNYLGEIIEFDGWLNQIIFLCVKIEFRCVSARF